MADQSLPFHEQSIAMAGAPADAVFAYLDDPRSLSAHMGKSSMMMLGSRMSTEIDANGGRVVGSRIRMHGSMLGISLALDEVVIERQAPLRKVWKTVGTPKLLIMAHYRMGFEVTPRGDSSLLHVFIDYSLPTSVPGEWLGRLLGSVYARWCTNRMVDDAVKHFELAMAGRV